MRSLILLCTIGFLSSFISAQNFEVISSFPEQGAFGVLTDSILITFSEAIDIDLDNEDATESGFYAAIEPESSFTFDSLALDEDGTTLKIFGEFEADTDYLVYILDAVSVTGKHLSSPFILQFTTYANLGPYSLSGNLNLEDFDEFEELQLHGYAVLLADSAPEFSFYEPDDDDEGGGETQPKENPFTWKTIADNHDDEEDAIVPIYAALVDTSNGTFEINGIRDGTYFPLAFNLFEVLEMQLEEDYEDEFNLNVFRYDADGDRGIDSVFYDPLIPPSQLPDDIELTFLQYNGFTIDEAFDITEAFFDVNEIESLEIFGGFAEYESEDYYDFSFKSSATTNESDPLFFEVTGGTSDVWNVFAYDASIDSVAFIIVTPVGAEIIEIVGEDDVEDPVDFSAFKSLPDNFLGSDDAFEIMISEGLSASYFEMEYVFGYDFYWDFELQLLHEYWEFPPDPTPTAPVTWKGTLYGYTFDDSDGTHYDAEYIIYIDAVTGDVLFEYATPVPDVGTVSLVDYSFPDENFGPAGDSLVFEFDGALDLNLDGESPEEIGFLLFVEPEDSLEFQGISYTELDESSRVTVYVSLAEDTDYVVFLADVNGTDGEVLDQPYILQFTTGNTDNRFTISGYLETPDIDINNYFRNVIVMLIEDAPEFGFDFFGEEGDDETDQQQDNHDEEEDDNFVPVYAANVDSESGYFEISLIREGNYYPIAFDIVQTEDGTETEEFFVPKIFYFDPNEDLFPDNLEINNTTAPTDTLEELELNALKFDRFTLSEAIEFAQRRIDALEIGEVEFAGGSTFYDFFGFEEINFKKGLNNLPTAIISDHEDAGPGMNPFFFELDGRNFLWELFIYHPAKDSALATIMTPIGAIFEGFIGEGDIEDPIEFDDLKSLPDEYIDSDSAAILFDIHGGAEFFEFLEQTYDPGTYTWSHQIQALHEYWDYPFNPTPDAPVAWKATYESYYYDGMAEESFSDSLVIYLDIETGALLHTVMSVDNEFENETPNQIQLGQNYPNPFNPTTNIPFQLSKASVVNIEVFNVLGQKVATLTNELYSAGSHIIAWNATNYSTGIYFYRLTAGDVIQTRKLMLIK